MIVLTRRIGERIYIGDDIIIEVVDTEGTRAKVGVDAPREVLVLREEVTNHHTKPNAPSLDPAGGASGQRIHPSRPC